MCVHYRPSIIACHVFYCNASDRLVLLLLRNLLSDWNFVVYLVSVYLSYDFIYLFIFVY